MLRCKPLSVLLPALGFGLLAASAQAQNLDPNAWLRRPGVKLLAVEFYATWCKPCMKAVPRWEKLRQKYADQGLRLVVVSTQDPGGLCANPGWNPDDMVCDNKGDLAEAFGAQNLPAAFLWNWQGKLMVRRGHVDHVESAIEKWMRRTPRVLVQVETTKGAGISKKALLNLVRGELTSRDKIEVVASRKERKAMHQALARVMSDPTYDSSRCEVGNQLPPNTVLKAGITDGQLYLKLLDMKKGCMTQSAVVSWKKSKARVKVGEVVSTLLDKLRQPAQMPGGAAMSRARPKRNTSGADRSFGEAPQAWDPNAEAGAEVIVSFSSKPAGAVVLVDNQLLCQSTPCSKSLTTGTHQVSIQKDRYLAKTQAVAIKNGSTINWELTANFGTLNVDSTPSGLNVSLNNKSLGTTPISGHELSPGRYKVSIDDRCFYKKGEEFSISAGSNKSIDLSMAAKEGAIKVSAEDEKGNALSADVFVDGTKVGQSPGTFKVGVCAKEVQVKHKTGTWKQTVSITERKVSPVKAVIKAQPAAPSGPVKFDVVAMRLNRKKIDLSTTAELKRGKTIENFKAIIPRAPKSRKAEGVFRLAELYWQSSKYQDQRGEKRRSELIMQNALMLYEKVRSEYPQYPRIDEVLSVLGYAEFKAGNKKKAIKHYEALKKKFPKSRRVSEAYLQLGEYYFDQSSMFFAKQNYEKALNNNDKFARDYALYKLAWVYFNLSEYAGGIKKLKEVIQRTGNDGYEGWDKLQAAAKRDLPLFEKYAR